MKLQRWMGAGRLAEASTKKGLQASRQLHGFFMVLVWLDAQQVVIRLETAGRALPCLGWCLTGG